MIEVHHGLDGVYVADTKLCRIDGQKGELVYAGYDIFDLAENSTFEETAFLLWNLRLPTRSELEELKAQFIAERPLSDLNRKLLNEVAAVAQPMRALEICVMGLGAVDPDSSQHTPEHLRRMAIRMTSRMATIVAAYHRIRNGLEPVAPRDDLNYAANFLYMLNDREPTEFEAHVFDVALILHAEHEMNASTFSAIVTASTLSDMYSAIASAIGTLKGPLHGGANDAAYQTFAAIGSKENVKPYIDALLERGERVMGIGHRVYKTTDPRAVILEKLGHQLADQAEDRSLFDISVAARDYLAEKLAGRPLYPNVDFFSATVYQMLGIPNDLYTTLFAMARIVGWSAHLLEQYANNRLVRPNALYGGSDNRPYVPIEQRG